MSTERYMDHKLDPVTQHKQVPSFVGHMKKSKENPASGQRDVHVTKRKVLKHVSPSCKRDKEWKREVANTVHFLDESGNCDQYLAKQAMKYGDRAKENHLRRIIEGKVPLFHSQY